MLECSWIDSLIAKVNIFDKTKPSILKLGEKLFTTPILLSVKLLDGTASGWI
jgi:hypothetical protein